VQLHHLLVRGVRELFATVTDVAEEEAGQAIQITLSLVIVYVASLASYDDRSARVSSEMREVDPEVAARELLQLLRRDIAGHGRILVGL
jgi:hypothetical protein